MWPPAFTHSYLLALQLSHAEAPGPSHDAARCPHVINGGGAGERRHGEAMGARTSHRGPARHPTTPRAWCSAADYVGLGYHDRTSPVGIHLHLGGRIPRRHECLHQTHERANLPSTPPLRPSDHAPNLPAIHPVGLGHVHRLVSEATDLLCSRSRAYRDVRQPTRFSKRTAGPEGCSGWCCYLLAR